MSLRTLITTVVASVVGLAVGGTSVVAFTIFDQNLRRQLDDSLRARATQVIARSPAHRPGAYDIPQSTDTAEGYLQILVLSRSQQADIPDRAHEPDVGAHPEPSAEPAPDISPTRQIALAPVTQDVARGSRQEALFHQRIDGIRFRLYARHLNTGAALVIGRAVDDLDAALNEIRALALGIGGAGVGVAALLGWLVGLAALRPVSRVTSAIEAASATRDLAHRVDVRRADELGRLAHSVNQLLGALDESQRARQQLVADASHELRSPLASLRTNVEVLTSAASLAESDRRPLVRDVLGQLQELTALIDDLVALARGRTAAAAPDRLSLDELVDGAVERIMPRARAKGITVEQELAPCVVLGVASDLQRAFANLLDNAVKWSPEGGTVEVTLTSDGTLTVRDHGPGISSVDRPHVFDRFYRSPSARSLPGSGLGLAIVSKVVEEHDGAVSAGPAAGGGALLSVTLPAVTTTA